MPGAGQPELRPARRENSAASPELERLGLRDSRVAFGLAGIGGAWGPIDPGIARETLRRAFALGIDVFDAAPAYGSAESLLGTALAEWKGVRPVISTKVGRMPASDGHEIKFDYSTEEMRASLQRSLDVIGVPNVDLVFLHEPQFVPVEERARVIATLQQFKADGLTRRLGLAGGHGEGWDGFIEAGIFEVVMLFRRLDACIFDGLATDLPRVRAAGLATYGASPLHMGLLGSRYQEFVSGRPDWVWKDQIACAIRLHTLAERRGVLLPELAHRFLCSAAEIDRVVIGARTPAELHDGWAAVQAGPLPEDLFDAICAAQ